MRRASLHGLTVIVVAAAAAGAAGCGGSDFAPATWLSPGSLRLLGTQAVPAEVAPGTEVTLRALITDGGAIAGDDVTVEWRRCTLGVNAAATSSINPDCLKRDDAEALVPLGSGRSVTFTLPPLDEKSLGLPDATLGVYVPIRLTMRASGGRVLDGIYRLRVRPRQVPLPLNGNPTLAGMWFVPEGADKDAGMFPSVPDGDTPIPDGGTGVPTGAVELRDGVPFEMRSGVGWTLRALFADGSVEKYTTASVDFLTGEVKVVEKSETLTVRWYASAARVVTPITGVEIPDTDLNLDERAPTPGTIVDVYAVGRDERAGTTWLHRQLLYR